MTRALIVDDKPENLYLLRALLQGHGYGVEEARHGAEALVKARQSPPQLIISDLLMPVMDGYTLLRHWKSDERLKAIPFIVYTATYTEPRDEQLALDLGADAFIVKPAEPAPFIARVVEILAKAERGEFAPALAPSGDEKVLLKEYSEILVRKLEEKAHQLEQSNRELLEDIGRREKSEAERNRLLEETERSRAALLSILEDQRETESALRQSDEKLRLFVNFAPSAIAMFDREMRYIAFSRRWLADYRLPDRDITGRSHYEVFPDLPEQWKDIHRRCQAGAVEKADEDRFPRGDGSVDWVRWEVHPWHTGTGGIGGIIIFSEVITARKLAEDALRESRARLQALTRRLLEMQETERRSVARELHDEVGGALTAVKLNLQSLRGKRAEAPGDAALADGLALVDGAIQSVRSLSLDLRPAVLDDLGLIPALRWYCERQAQRAGVAIETALEAIDLNRAPHLESACFRIAQEAVTNALRHAQARRIEIALRRSDGSFVLEIADDGAGFDVAAARKQGLAGESSGLLGIEERTALLGGRLEIDSAPGAGTRVRVEFAVPEEGFS